MIYLYLSNFHLPLPRQKLLVCLFETVLCYLLRRLCSMHCLKFIKIEHEKIFIILCGHEQNSNEEITLAFLSNISYLPVMYWKYSSSPVPYSPTHWLTTKMLPNVILEYILESYFEAAVRVRINPRICTIKSTDFILFILMSKAHYIFYAKRENLCNYKYS